MGDCSWDVVCLLLLVVFDFEHLLSLDLVFDLLLLKLLFVENGFEEIVDSLVLAGFLLSFLAGFFLCKLSFSGLF